MGRKRRQEVQVHTPVGLVDVLAQATNIHYVLHHGGSQPGITVEELRRHALRLMESTPHRFRVLRTFDGPATDLGARAREVIRAEISEDDADR